MEDGVAIESAQRTVSLEIIHNIGKSEVKIKYFASGQRCSHGQTSVLAPSFIDDSLTSVLFDMDSVIDLPLIMNFATENREIQVDGTDYLFHGISSSLNGDRSGWAGFATIDDERELSIVIGGEDLASLELSTVTNWAMPDRER